MRQDPIRFEWSEKIDRLGHVKATLQCDELRAARSWCTITEIDLGHGDGNSQRFSRKTCNGSAGSTRYAQFKTLAEAYEATVPWIKRKVYDHRQQVGIRTASTMFRFARLLATGSQWGPR
jgi:hypothetical protein